MSRTYRGYWSLPYVLLYIRGRTTAEVDPHCTVEQAVRMVKEQALAQLNLVPMADRSTYERRVIDAERAQLKGLWRALEAGSLVAYKPAAIGEGYVPIPAINWVSNRGHLVASQKAILSVLKLTDSETRRPLTPADSETDLSLSNIVLRAEDVRRYTGDAASSIDLPDSAETQMSLREASPQMIRHCLCEVYAEANDQNQKPPNVREAVAPVRHKLTELGFCASGLKIQQIASAAEFQKFRWKPGQRRNP